MMAQLWRDALAGHPGVHVVANADDPMVVWAGAAAPPARHLVQRRPALARRLLGLPRVRRAHRARADERLVVHRLRPAPARAAVGGRATTASSTRPAPGTRCSCNCPARSTSATRPPRWPSPPSSACARPTRSRGSARSPRSPAGTPRSSATAGTIRLLLAKNPASWLEAFDMAEDAPTLLSINARDPDGLDTSWLFDVDFSPLRGRQVLITGDRAIRPGRPAGGQRRAVRARHVVRRGASPRCRPAGWR